MKLNIIVLACLLVCSQITSAESKLLVPQSFDDLQKLVEDFGPEKNSNTLIVMNDDTFKVPHSCINGHVIFF